MTEAAPKALESAPAHARGKQEPVGSNRAMYVCECCKDAGEEHCLYPREDMRIFEGEWRCEECAQQACPDADTLPLAPELFASPPAESEEVARLGGALEEIRELNMLDADENGHKWANSDLIGQTVWAALSASPAPAADTGEPITLIYRNWRGEVAERTVLPKRLWWGATEWHPEPQWLMSGTDVEKGTERDFAVRICRRRHP